jgi:RND family efflux transporter MFP subunit
LAERERERADSLQQKNVINPAQYDAALSAATIARAREAEARTAAEHTVLRAPFAGVITAKLANLGDTVIPGQPLLVLEAPHALRFEARVPEVTSENLRIGQQLPIRLDGLEHDLAGNVVEIQPSCDVVTRTRLIKLDLPASPGLRAGRFGRLLLATANTLAISVPSTALVRHGQLEGVFVVDAGVAQLRLVRSGRSQSGRTEIASGLSGDEPVVLDGAAELVDGQRVAVLP